MERSKSYSSATDRDGKLFVNLLHLPEEEVRLSEVPYSFFLKDPFQYHWRP